jgi:hypothetical protein
MQNSVKTSELLKYRVSHCVPERTEAIIKVRTSYTFIFTEYHYGEHNIEEHVACIGQIVHMASVGHGTAELYRKPASTVRSLDSHSFLGCDERYYRIMFTTYSYSVQKQVQQCPRIHRQYVPRPTVGT